MLRMAATKQKKDLIKWLYARRTIFAPGGGFDASRFAQGLRLASQCEHEDARFLVSLFPGEAPATTREAATSFLAAGDDARALCWAALCDGDEDGFIHLLHRSAEGGYALAQSELSFGEGVEDLWLQKAAVQGEVDATRRLAYQLWSSVDELKQDKARQLWLQAAELGTVALTNR